MPNTKDAAVLSAVAGAVSWKNEAIEPMDPPRKGKRVVVYPKELSHLDTVINSGDPSVDADHEIAYQVILEHAQTFEVPPVFIKEDGESIAAHPEMSLKVPSWMCIAERIATGSRKRVTEDGPDTWHSDDGSKTDVEADKEANMYTSEMDPTLGPQKLSPLEAHRLRTAAKGSQVPTSASSTDVSSDFGNSIVSSPVSTRPPTPMNSDNEDLGKVTSGAPGTRSRAVPEPPRPDSANHAVETKAAASQQAPAVQPKRAKAPPPIKGQVKGQESPETKASHPMAKRTRSASGAGSLRGVDGSGSIGAVCGSSSPARKPGS
jgi:hypothetical protein